ncbi:MAG TPA: TraB/GumN family protein [Chthoniobacterales bacterium]
MRRRCALAVLVAGLSWALNGCADSSSLLSGHSTLWRVEGEHNAVYLLGSIHVLPPSAYPFKSSLQRAFKASARIAFEVDLSASTSHDVTREFKRSGWYPSGDTLSRHVSPDTELLLKRVLPALGTSWERVQRLRPWFLAELVSSRYLQSAGFRDDLGVDEYFYRKAQAEGKPVQGLETLRDQAQILTGFTDRDSEEYLRSTLTELPASLAMLQVLVLAWQNGQIGLLDRLLNQNERADPTAFRMMFSDRNAKWLPILEGFTHAEKNVMVIVGAGHLVGEEGLVQALRRHGYKVRQL